jgi:hypothetical protein
VQIGYLTCNITNTVQALLQEKGKSNDSFCGSYLSIRLANSIVSKQQALLPLASQLHDFFTPFQGVNGLQVNLYVCQAARNESPSQSSEPEPKAKPSTTKLL